MELSLALLEKVLPPRVRARVRYCRMDLLYEPIPSPRLEHLPKGWILTTVRWKLSSLYWISVNRESRTSRLWSIISIGGTLAFQTRIPSRSGIQLFNLSCCPLSMPIQPVIPFFPKTVGKCSEASNKNPSVSRITLPFEVQLNLLKWNQKPSCSQPAQYILQHRLAITAPIEYMVMTLLGWKA